MVQALVVLGFLLMLYNTYTGFQMKSKAPGGVIGERLTQLNLFVLLFALGYLAVALLTWSRPVDTLESDFILRSGICLTGITAGAGRTGSTRGLMQIYRQTSRALDIFLSRDERLVYTLCREEISDIVLAQRTQLPLDVLNKALSALLEHGLIEIVASSQSEPSRPAEHTPDKLVAAKAQLAAILKAELGEHAAKFLPEIERKQSLGELEEWSRKLVI
jgi:hypothetical protein